jgi:WD40 repeat protein
VPGWVKQWFNTSLSDDISACRFARNGDFAGGDISSNIYSFQSNYVKRFSVNSGANRITGIDFSPDSQYFVASSQSGKVMIYQPTLGSTPISFTESNPTLSVSYNKDATYYVTASSNTLTSWYNGSIGMFSTKVTSFN